jgi:Ser/Thr protein kinase RdoA (MazF antagonist)
MEEQSDDETALRSSVELELKGGVANAGAVTRVGEHVLRPSNRHTATIHRFLRHLADEDFDGAPIPVGVERDGRERLEFVAGDVPLPPYPQWARTDDALASIARLMARFHCAARSFVTMAGETWSDEMADPEGGLVVCHNDVCLENVVFRDGEAIALLDFDFAAPGRPVYDLACFARMCVPIDDDENRARFGWQDGDLPERLRLVADENGLDGDGRAEVMDALDMSMAHGGEFVRRRVEAGDPNFIAMWEDMGGMVRFDRRRAWWHTSRHHFAAAMS